MTTSYRLDFYDTSGVRRATLTPQATSDVTGRKSGFLSLAYTRRVNAPGLLQFTLPGNHEILANMAPEWQVEVHRRPAGQDWYMDFVGIYRQPDWSYTSRKIITCTCPGLMTLLDRRIVNWPANLANRTKFTSAKAETILKTLVEFNAAASATTGNGRKRNGAITGLTVQADGANGNTKDWYCAQANLLKTLQELAPTAGGDFDLVKTSTSAWQFQWFTGQLGADRTASVKFSVERGNMANVRYREIPDEGTVACVWGQGEDAGRDYVTRTGANYSASNDLEFYVDGKDIAKGDTAGLNARGDAKAKELEATSEFEFDGLQIPGSLYGVHYFLGDLVSAVNPVTGAVLASKLFAVTVSFENTGKEKITPEFSTP